MLKAKAGIQLRRDHSRNESLLDTIAGVLTPLARRLDASVLLLPSYIVAHEADDVACGSLAHRLERLDVRIARITDPHLYKAVLGHASLLISSRMHPLILAAAMGTPFVGLSFNKKFDGVFDLLNMHTQLLPLDDFPSRWGPRELLAEAETALEGRNDLRKKAEQLGDIVRQQTLAVAFGDA
jgi:polysaccharide pyruvyl transferase WcaK-like protein